METRKIIIVDSASNQKVVVNTDATNFGELKRAVRAAGINCEGKDWLEGITKTSPIGDDSLLPTNVQYKGASTNNLVYMLTNTNKRIKSGVSRKELYAEIKKLGIAEDIKNHFGRNFTQVPSEGLAEFISSKAQVSNVYKEKYNELIAILAKCALLIPADILDEIQEAIDKINSENAVKDIEFTDDELVDLFA